MYDELVKMLRICAEADSCTDCPYLYGGDCGYKAKRAADAIEALSAKVPQWIPVTGRLPDDGQWVLVWGHGQHIPTMMFRESGAWIDDQFEFHTTVTHWMPLPEPPKEVDT